MLMLILENPGSNDATILVKPPLHSNQTSHLESLLKTKWGAPRSLSLWCNTTTAQQTCPANLFFFQQGGKANVWYLNSCSCQCKMWEDKDGRYMSSAMGESSQVGNPLSSRLCVYASVKVCRAGLVDAWWACPLVWNIWASFWSTRVGSVAAAAQLSFLLLREMKWAWRAPMILPLFILPNLHLTTSLSSPPPSFWSYTTISLPQSR